MTETEHQIPEAAARPASSRWIRLSRVAAFTVVAWSVTLQAFEGAFIPPVAVIGVVFLGLALALRADRRRLAMVAGALAVLAVVGNLPIIIDQFSHPSSMPSFVLNLVVNSAMAVILVSGLAVWRGWSAQGIRPTSFAWVGVIVVGVSVSLAASASVESAEALSSDIQVVAQSIRFEPEAISVEAGSVGIWVDNRDGARHTFTIRDTDHEIDLPAFSSQRADFDLTPGTYEVICAVPGHESMSVDLTVNG
ncbi:MAG TPA: cupredoxin domain-containing protein [Acidimicrobiia bacterium]|nr:cupredoxin domain-containing protein [Acidimicrobiia bacterium]